MQSIRIEAVETVIVDLPLRRRQQFSALSADSQSIVLMFARSTDGVVGVGEAVTPSGPWWSGESVESIKLHVDTYLAPLLIGRNALALSDLMERMHKQVYGNAFAKAGLEMALLDLTGKTLGVAAHELIGGKVRDSLPVAWPLATGDAEREIEEAEEKLERRLHRTFKLKMGALPPDEDIDRACRIARALAGRAHVRVDPNEMWSEAMARSAIARLHDAGIDLIEQPLARWNVDGSARLTATSPVEIMIDEGMCTLQDMLRIAECHAAGTVSLKIMKSGGLRATRTIAEVAEAAGISLYMGTFLESSFGTAANMQLCATLRDLPYGGELIGPLLIAEDICQESPDYRDFELHLNDGVGMAAEIDDDKLKRFRRDGSQTVHAVA